MKNLIAALAMATIVLCSTTLFAQAYKPDFATKIVLAGGGTSLVNTTTLLAPAGNSNTITFPTTSPTLGYMLTTDASGNLSFTNPATGVVLAGDITGNAGSNVIAATAAAGNHAVTAINLGAGVIDIANGGTNSGAALTASAIAVSNGTALVQGPLGTTSTVLHGNIAGLPSYGSVVTGDIGAGAVNLTTQVSGILPPANGGTGIANANANTLTLGMPVSYVGGTSTGVTFNFAAGATSVTFPTSGTLLASGSAAGGDLAGTYPNPTIAATAGAGNDAVAAINLGAGVIKIANGGTNSGAALTASAIAVSNGTALVQGPLGTTSTVLHGNIAGLPSYGSVVTGDIGAGAVNLTTQVSGILPPANGGTGIANANANTLTLGMPVSYVGGTSTGVTFNFAAGATNITFPTSGTLLASGSAAGGDLAGTYPNPTIAATAGAGNDAVAAINLGAGIIKIANGGTNSAATPTAGAVAYGDGSAHQFTLAGTAGQVLQSNGAGTPTWVNAGATVTFAPSTTNVMAAGNNINFAIDGTHSVYYLQNATGSNVNLTGIVAAASDRLIIIVNNSTGAANSITLTNQDGTSTAANQFHLQGGSNILLGVDGTATLIYDSTANAGAGAWRVISAY